MHEAQPTRVGNLADLMFHRQSTAHKCYRLIEHERRLHILHPLLPKQTTVTALRPDLIILNLPKIMSIELLLIECSFTIPVALPNIYNTNFCYNTV